MVYALICQMLPNKEGVIRTVMSHETFSTFEEAEEAQTKARHQNLPFRAWVISFPDPREEISE